MSNAIPVRLKSISCIFGYYVNCLKPQDMVKSEALPEDNSSRKQYAINGTEDTMITCKFCNTRLEKKNLRRDGSMLCPECGQIYWKAAVEKAMLEPAADEENLRNRIETKYKHESKRTTEFISRRVKIA